MNFFKNALIYRLSRDITIVEEHTIADLADKLEPFRFSPCGSQDMAKSGWVSPLGQYSDQLFHFVSGQLLLVIRREEKISHAQPLPMSSTRKFLSLNQNRRDV